MSNHHGDICGIESRLTLANVLKIRKHLVSKTSVTSPWFNFRADHVNFYQINLFFLENGHLNAVNMALSEFTEVKPVLRTCATA